LHRVRIPGPGLIVAILVAIAAAIGALSFLGSRDGHVPRTDAEIVAATYAETYARTLDAHRADLACELATQAAARKIGCGTAHRRAPPPCGSGEIKVGDSDDSRAEVHIGGCKLTLMATEQAWKVADDVRE
jgi:uncharacterized protein YbbK (DUF523 family)